MQFPASFNDQRATLESLCKQVNTIAVHSYQTANELSSAQGAALLANAIEDTSRLTRPSNWHAVILVAITNKADSLSSKLQATNALCPLTPFVEAQRFALSFSSIEQHKIQRSTGNEQSIEWQAFKDCRTIPAINTAFNDASLALVADEGTGLINGIDSALTELAILKSTRNTRLTEKLFIPGNLPIDVMAFSANSARSLADAVKNLGNNQMHWAFMAFVGSNDDIKPIKELFL